MVIPARPYRPKDKSRVELTVLLVCRWILARLRHQRFFSLEELNAAIRPLLADLNARSFQRLPGSRHSVFEALDRPAMRALPAHPHVFAEWKELKVAFDYHVDVDHHYYSVPHALVGHQAWARFTAASVEVFFRSERVATHVRSYQRGLHTTVTDHMPKSHQAHAQWSLSVSRVTVNCNFYWCQSIDSWILLILRVNAVLTGASFPMLKRCGCD